MAGASGILAEESGFGLGASSGSLAMGPKGLAEESGLSLGAAIFSGTGLASDGLAGASGILAEESGLSLGAAIFSWAGPGPTSDASLPDASGAARAPDASLGSTCTHSTPGVSAAGGSLPPGVGSAAAPASKTGDCSGVGDAGGASPTPLPPASCRVSCPDAAAPAAGASFTLPPPAVRSRFLSLSLYAGSRSSRSASYAGSRSSRSMPLFRSRLLERSGEFRALLISAAAATPATPQNATIISCI